MTKITELLKINNDRRTYLLTTVMKTKRDFMLGN